MNSCQDGLEDNKPFWTVEVLMEMTGLAKQTIYNRKEDIPHRKKFGRLYFFPDEIINWIDEGNLE